MLVDGDIDALHTARMPSTFLTRPDKVRRLFPDHAQVEQQYFRDTGIFLIMHTVVIRREVFDENRWVCAGTVQGLR
jgi:4,5-dihydroxyphthalate decarboxylase